MNVPLRALNWAIRFFWIIALAFGVTCVYSATLIRVNFGEPVMSPTENSFTVMLPVIFDNRGYYNIGDLNITTVISDNEDNQISNATSYIAQIRPQNNVTIFHNVSLNLDEIVTRAEYLFNDSNFTLYGVVHLNYADVIPFRFEANTTMPWGAPLFNFTVGMPEYSAYDVLRLRVNVPISFENHSPYFSVTGTIRIEIFNDRHQQLGSGEVSVDVPPYAFYDGEITTVVDSELVTERGQIFVYVETAMFDYGPVVINYG